MEYSKEFYIEFCEWRAFTIPLADYRTRVIWEKIGCRYWPACHVTPLPQLLNCNCKFPNLKCERCGTGNPIVHHTAYCPEALPREDNKRWLKYYKLLCEICHRKEHYEHPELNNRQAWDQLVRRTVGRGPWQPDVYEALQEFKWRKLPDAEKDKIMRECYNRLWEIPDKPKSRGNESSDFPGV